MIFTQNLSKVEDEGDSSPYSDSSSPDSPEIQENIADWLDFQQTLKKTLITNGQSIRCPRKTSVCLVLIVQQIGLPLKDYPLEFKLDTTSTIIIGECDSSIGRSIEKVLLTMKEKEVCEVLCLIKKLEFMEVEGSHCPFSVEGAAFGDSIEFRFKIELQSFQEQPDIHQLDNPLKLEHAAHHKAAGVKLFQNGLVRAAFYRFSKAAKFLIFLSPEEFEEKTALQVACYLNMAACQLQTGQFDHAVENCTKVLNVDANNVKAYYRRGVAYLNLKEYEKSMDDLNKVVELEPKNAAAKQKIKIVNKEMKKLDQYYAKQMKKLFV